jgi:YjbE family integral membrane protein
LALTNLDLFSTAALSALLQVLVINIVLSGDNVIVIGAVAARVKSAERPRVIGWGMGAAIALRIVLAVLAVDLLAVLGLTLAGGILLLWVAWRLYRDSVGRDAPESSPAVPHRGPAPVTFGRAILQVAVADISMSIDNALAVAGAANRNVPVLIIGLGLSVAIMAVAATYVARLLQRFPWLSWVGVLLVLYVALSMIWRGSGEVSVVLHQL